MNSNSEKIHQAFENLEASDIYECDIRDVHVGKRVRSAYGDGEMIPTFRFTYHQDDGRLAQEFAQPLPVGKHDTAELQWADNRLFVENELEGKSIPPSWPRYGGEHEEYGPTTVDKLPLPIKAGSHSLDIIIPMSSKFPGIRTVTIYEAFDAQRVDTSVDMSKLTPTEISKTVKQTCGTAVVRVNGSGSAELLSFTPPAQEATKQ